MISRQAYRQLVARLCPVALAMLVIAAVTGSAGSVRAAGATCTTRYTHLHDGGYTPGSTSVFGVSARIEFSNPDLCGTDASTNVWSVVYAMVYDGNRYFAQSGYGQWGGSVPQGPGNIPPGFHTFSQYTNACYPASCGGGAPIVSTNWGPNPNQTETYTSKYISSASKIFIYHDSVILDTTSYNPLTVWSGVWEGQFDGETEDSDTDIVGTAADQTQLYNIQFFGPGGAAHFFSVVTPHVPDLPRYHVAKYSPTGGGTGLLLWTDPL